MLEEENKKETQESEQVPAAERIQEPERKLSWTIK